MDEGVATSDLGTAASRKALEAAGVSKDEVDLVIFATMTPDHYFPGCGGLLQAKLDMRNTPCFDIRQQCVGFVYGLQLADAQIRAGFAKTVLLVGAEVHAGFMPYTKGEWDYLYGKTDVAPSQELFDKNTRFRDRIVLFGDGGGAVVLRATEDEGSGVIDTILRTTDGSGTSSTSRASASSTAPTSATEQLERWDQLPIVEGRPVFKLATTLMAEVAQEILRRNRLLIEDVDMVLMHQANLRINTYVQKMLGLPDSKVHNNIQRYGNTTAATIPLCWDECVREGRIKKVGLVLMVALGGGLHWGATLLRA